MPPAEKTRSTSSIFPGVCPNAYTAFCFLISLFSPSSWLCWQINTGIGSSWIWFPFLGYRVQVSRSVSNFALTLLHSSFLFCTFLISPLLVIFLIITVSVPIFLRIDYTSLVACPRCTSSWAPMTAALRDLLFVIYTLGLKRILIYTNFSFSMFFNIKHNEYKQ